MRGVHECGSIAEAEILKGYLAGHGINATYDGDGSLGFIGKYRAMRGVTLRVPALQAQAARKLIDKADFSAQAKAVEDEGSDNWRDVYTQERTQRPAKDSDPKACPNCGSQEIHPEGPPRWLNRLLLGLPMLFVRETWACAGCGWYWHP